ncbi:MAG: PEP-CTERM sorting domain-containing protein [Sedimentisphaerales bacterium]|nr:PEP-CTERM sorting domain-containing protein [Sedimentisphaerales bacterium]
MKRRTIQLVALMVGFLSTVTAVRATEPESPWTAAYDLCIEHSPVKAGTVTPRVGTHRYSANSIVTLSASPQPGYQFAYWIGDVSDPKSRQTTVKVDAAKIVVAVFRSVRDNGMERTLALSGGGGGPSQLLPSLTDLKSPGFSVSGGGGAKTVPVPVPVPVVPTPEPTSVLLLGLGALALRRAKHRS